MTGVYVNMLGWLNSLRLSVHKNGFAFFLDWLYYDRLVFASDFARVVDEYYVTGSRVRLSRSSFQTIIDLYTIIWYATAVLKKIDIFLFNQLQKKEEVFLCVLPYSSGIYSPIWKNIFAFKRKESVVSVWSHKKLVKVWSSM